MNGTHVLDRHPADTPSEKKPQKKKPRSELERVNEKLTSEIEQVVTEIRQRMPHEADDFEKRFSFIEHNHEGMRHFFTENDTNHDRKLDKAEFAKVARDCYNEEMTNSKRFFRDAGFAHPYKHLSD